MQTFQNMVDKSVWQFELDVVAANTAGVYSFSDARGVALTVPKTLVPYTIPAPTPAALLVLAQQAQSALLNTACAAAITGGFTSAALGSAYKYPSQPTDQTNLAANILSSIYPALPATWTTPQLCCDAKGNWAYLAHSAAQIQQVGADGKAAILSSLTHNAAQQAAIVAATTPAAVQAVVW